MEPEATPQVVSRSLGNLELEYVKSRSGNILVSLYRLMDIPGQEVFVITEPRTEARMRSEKPLQLIYALRMSGLHQFAHPLDWFEARNCVSVVLTQPENTVSLATLPTVRNLREQDVKIIISKVVEILSTLDSKHLMMTFLDPADIICNPETNEVYLANYNAVEENTDEDEKRFRGEDHLAPTEFITRRVYRKKPAAVFGVGLLTLHLLTSTRMSYTDKLRMKFRRTNLSEEAIQFLKSVLTPHPEDRVALRNLPYDDWLI